MRSDVSLYKAPQAFFHLTLYNTGFKYDNKVTSIRYHNFMFRLKDNFTNFLCLGLGVSLSIDLSD